MRLYFDRNFKFGGYSQTPQELFDGYSRLAGAGCVWHLSLSLDLW